MKNNKELKEDGKVKDEVVVIKTCDNCRLNMTMGVCTNKSGYCASQSQWEPKIPVRDEDKIVKSCDTCRYFPEDNSCSYCFFKNQWEPKRVRPKQIETQPDKPQAILSNVTHLYTFSDDIRHASIIFKDHKFIEARFSGCQLIYTLDDWKFLQALAGEIIRLQEVENAM